jgi:hypothetical protein
MATNASYEAMLKPLFDLYRVPMTPAGEKELDSFSREAEKEGVPSDVVSQLVGFYSVVNGVPCLDSLSIFSCSDPTIYEWWEHGELWLGGRDYHVLRWTKGRYCIGDAGTINFSPDDEYHTFSEALRYLVKVYDSGDSM